MPLPLMAIGAIASAVPQVVKGISGIFQARKGNRLRKSLVRPTEVANPLYQQNVAMAEQMGRVGLPQEQYNNQLNNISRNQAGVLRRFGGSGNNLASILRASNDATNNLVADDSGARMNNQRFAFGQRGILANAQERAFAYNKKGRYEDDMNYANSLIGAGKQNQMSALDGLSTIGQQYMAGEQGGGYGGMETDATMGGNFMPNQANMWGRLMGRNRQPYIGRMAGQTGFSR